MKKNANPVKVSAVYHPHKDAIMYLRAKVDMMEDNCREFPIDAQSEKELQAILEEKHETISNLKKTIKLLENSY